MYACMHADGERTYVHTYVCMYDIYLYTVNIHYIHYISSKSLLAGVNGLNDIPIISQLFQMLLSKVSPAYHLCRVVPHS